MITFRTSTDTNVRFDKQSYRELLLFFYLATKGYLKFYHIETS